MRQKLLSHNIHWNRCLIFSCTFFIWCKTLHFSWNALPQIWHLKDFLPPWTCLLCLCSVCFSANSELHKSHLCSSFASFELLLWWAVHICLCNEPLVVKHLLQMLHSKFTKPSWNVFTCRFNEPEWLNVFSQKQQDFLHLAKFVSSSILSTKASIFDLHLNFWP